MPDRAARIVFGSAAAAAGLALVGVMLLTVLDVVLRFALDSPIPGTFELTELAMVVIAFLGLGQAQRRQQHITVDVVYEALGKVARRVVDGAARAVCLLLSVLTGWQLWMYLLRARADAEVSGILRVPVYLVVGAALLGFTLYALALLMRDGTEADAA